ncbi:hypothetical protein H113_04067 [Trichophyton rubrum MR1459]|uniref:Uncharacterized protein n=2 Tax=Trichophyton TaxID=5550 RepID=A0A080WH97_TRIRC|nr:uncharacterized protein TERG_12271 [Trichophyton rubrum CBS 118892]EZF95620.1 hypothetical protein H113_04067 [Trichophyton rubrum MR1459]EZG06714.1 hypothetical protein H106_03852 [Trichophyton rubrum CBS 735.88]KFL61926.1 hypothetical protein TERG_12271 [Trichophyton rubrum CBS 118892]KMQ45514.1 hypothetical protein HL42_3758 [Trichophyton rubrum]
MLFPLEEQIGPRAAQVDNLRTPIPILLQSGTFETVERVTDPFPATYNAFVLEVAKGAFIAHAHQSRRPHIGVADGTFAVTFVAQAPDSNAGLLSAHNEIWVMTRHDGRFVYLNGR